MDAPAPGEELIGLDVGVDTYDALTQRLKEALARERCSFYIHDPERHEVWSVAAIGLEIAEIRLPTNRGVVGYVARTGHLLNLKDVYNDPRFDRSVDKRMGYRTKSMLTMAIKDKDGNVRGVLQALSKVDGTFTAADEGKMALLAGRALDLIGSSNA